MFLPMNIIIMFNAIQVGVGVLPHYVHMFVFKHIESRQETLKT